MRSILQHARTTQVSYLFTLRVAPAGLHSRPTRSSRQPNRHRNRALAFACGPFDLPKGPTSRSGVTSRPTGTGDSTALTPCVKSDTVRTNVRAEGVARSSGEGGRRPRFRGRPGDPWDGSGRPARAQAEPGRSRRGASCAMRITASLGLTLLRTYPPPVPRPSFRAMSAPSTLRMGQDRVRMLRHCT